MPGDAVADKQNLVCLQIHCGDLLFVRLHKNRINVFFSPDCHIYSKVAGFSERQMAGQMVSVLPENPAGTNS